jgi:hypothetical protein
MDRSDKAVLEAIQNDVMNPDVIAATLRKALARLKPTAKAAEARRIEMERQLAGVNQQIERPMDAVAIGGNLQTIVKSIKEREEQRDTLTRQIASLAGAERAGQSIGRWWKSSYAGSWTSGGQCFAGMFRRPVRCSKSCCQGRSDLRRIGRVASGITPFGGDCVCNYGGVPNGRPTIPRPARSRAAACGVAASAMKGTEADTMWC